MSEDIDGTNIEASRLLNEHHAVTPRVDSDGYDPDNCDRCGFAAGRLQIPGEDSIGHATLATPAEVTHWINTAGGAS